MGNEFLSLSDREKAKNFARGVIIATAGIVSSRITIETG
jgi:hypothetical protein